MVGYIKKEVGVIGGGGGGLKATLTGVSIANVEVASKNTNSGLL